MSVNVADENVDISIILLPFVNKLFSFPFLPDQEKIPSLNKRVWLTSGVIESLMHLGPLGQSGKFGNQDGPGIGRKENKE